MKKSNLKLEKIWSQVPPDYYEKGVKKNPLQCLWHKKKIDKLKSILRGKSYSKICDAGCAGGYMTNEISSLFPKSEIFGLDVYKTAVEYARKRYKHIKFICCDLHKIPIENGPFDLVICYETIEHVTDPRKVLDELQRVTKDDGTIVIAMDTGNFLFRIVWFIWERTKGRVWRNAHLHPFKQRQLEDLIRKAGFEIQRKIFSNFGMEVIFVLGKSPNTTH